MKPDNIAIAMALAIVILMISHLSHDVIYGYEPANLKILVAVPILALWLYAAVALAGRRSGYILLIIGSYLAAIVPIVHMSGRGVRDEVVQSGGGFFFIWGLIALATIAAVSFLLSIHGLWRLKQSILGFLLSTLVAVLAGGALLASLVYSRG